MSQTDRTEFETFQALIPFVLKQAGDVMKGNVNINLIVFGFCLAWMIVFTFLPPIILSGLVFVFLLVARLAIPPKTL